MSDGSPETVGESHRAAPGLMRRTLTSSLWSFAATGTQLVVRLSVLILLARLLAPTDFGIVTAAVVVVNFLDLFSLLGVSPALVQKPDLRDEDISTGFLLSLGLGCITGLAIAVLAVPIAAFFKIAQLGAVLPFLAFNFPLKGAAVASLALLQRQMRFKAVALLTVCSYLLGYVLVAVTLAVQGWGYWALVFGQLAETSVSCAGLLYLARPKFSLTVHMTTVKHLMRFGSGYSLARIGNYVALNGDNFVVGRFLGAAALGVYSRAYQFLMLPTNLIGNVIDQVFLPAMVAARDDEARLGRAYELALSVIAMVMLPLSAVLVVLSPHVVFLLLGRQWDAAVLPFQFFAATLVCRSGYKVSDTLWKAKSLVFGGAWRQWLYAGEVVLGAALGSIWGIAGVALFVALAIALHYIVMLAFAVQMTRVSPAVVVMLHVRHIAVALLCGGAAWLGSLAILSQGGSHILEMIGGIVAASLAGAFLWLLLPRLFGNEGAWIEAQLRTALGRRVVRS